MFIAQKFTDSTKNISDLEIRSGSSTCPTCKSDRWTSAITVVMDGTTNTKGNVIRTANADAKKGGNLHESLLSDRWFSWDYPIEAEIGLNASTGLVQEVKRFMVEHGPVVQIPSPPQKPNHATSVRISPRENQDGRSVAQTPISCGTVEDHVTRERSRQSTVSTKLVRLSIVIISLMIGLIGAYVLFDQDFISELTLLIIFASITTIAAFKVKRIQRGNMAKDETGRKDMENLSETLKLCAKDRENFQEEAKRSRNRYEEYERRLSKYKILADETILYEQQLADYRNKRRAVLKVREQFWERTRLCIKCGSAYLGPN